MKPKFKVGDKVKVVRKCEQTIYGEDIWVSEMDACVGKTGEVLFVDSVKGYVHVKTSNQGSWYFPSESLELVKEHKVKPKKQQYVVLVWDKREGLCGELVVDTTGDKTFIGTKKEAKEYRDIMRQNHPGTTYKIAKYPFITEGI